MKRIALTADLGGTKVAVACVDGAGRVTHQTSAPTPRAGGELVVRLLTRLLDDLPQEGACALGIAVPGLARPDASVWAPNIAGWNHMPLGAMLARHFKLPVVVESDRNACVVGETWKGAAQGKRDVIFVTIGTGIGAGIVSGGRLIRGGAELAGCLGWMAVGDDRFRPTYKLAGCLESYVAGPAIAGEARRVLKRSVAADEVVKLARGGDPQARAVLARAGRYLGLALANLVNILNPEVIVIGGGVASAGRFLLAPACQTMMKWAQPLAMKQVRIVRSRLGASAPLVGVAKLALAGAKSREVSERLF